MKLTDYVIDFLAQLGISHIFGVTGGAAVHLFDSAAKHPDITPIFNHHEQAAALAAESYARVSNNIGVAIVTTGPGGVNAMTGILAAWLDSVPCILISGQSRLEHTSHGKGVRQLGSQEFDVVSLASHITKYAVLVEDATMIKYHLQKAAYLAKTGRPGPTWIDLPLNLQWASVEPTTMRSFEPHAINEKSCPIDLDADLMSQCIELFVRSERPLILAGYGVRLSHAETELYRLITKLQIPFVTSWNARDLLPTEHPMHLGCLGFEGERAANLAVQNCDLLLCLGSHLSMPLTGTMFQAFAREAKILMVDIDPTELLHRNLRIDVPICCDVRFFLIEMEKQLKVSEPKDIKVWRNKCGLFKSRYSILPSDWKKQEQYVNPYVFIDMLSEELEGDDVIVVDGGGTITQIAFQTFKTKASQRLMISSGICAMGTGLPESIGAHFGSGGRRTICLVGDGSLQFNVQELQTIAQHNIPIKIFVFNNDGYIAIRHTQQGFLNSNYVGSSTSGGMSLPNYQRVAKAYGIQAIRINNHRELRRKMRKALMQGGPVLCEIIIDSRQEILPRMGSDKNLDGTATPRPLEDMYPYLERTEFLENMVVKPWGG